MICCFLNLKVPDERLQKNAPFSVMVITPSRRTETNSHRFFVWQLRSLESSNAHRRQRSLGARLHVELVLQGEGVCGRWGPLRAPAWLCKSFTRSALPLALSLWWMVIFIGLLMLNEPCASCLNWTHFMVFDFGASHRARPSLLPLVAHPPNHSPPAPRSCARGEWMKGTFHVCRLPPARPRGSAG